MTHAELLNLLDYDLETGAFTWKYTRPGISAGRRAGCYSSDGYIRIRVLGNLYLASRLAWFYMTGNWPRNTIDHKDLNKSNNSWDNLREATETENQCNRRIQFNNTSGYKGVHFCNTVQKWIAKIQRAGIVYYLGRFDTSEEAYQVYKNANDTLHGPFGRAL